MSQIIHALESRILFASAAVENGVLQVVGNPGDDFIVVEIGALSGDVEVRFIDGETFGPFALDSVEHITVRALGGNDTIDLNAIHVPSLLIGGKGDDEILGGVNPTLNQPEPAIMVGGAGADSITGHGILRGGGGPDVLLGTTRRDFIFGGGGADDILGNQGADVIFGGPGDDTAVGGPGKDVLFGNAGDDNLDGAAGTDRLYGSAGADNLTGSGGNDRVYGGLGNDTVDGGAGDNIVDQDEFVGLEEFLQEIDAQIEAFENSLR